MSWGKIEGFQRKRKEFGMRIKPDFRFIKGSVVVLKVTCGKANCRCMKGEKHQAIYLSQSVNGKTRITYIPGKYVKMVTEHVSLALNRQKESVQDPVLMSVLHTARKRLEDKSYTVLKQWLKKALDKIANNPNCNIYSLFPAPVT